MVLLSQIVDLADVERELAAGYLIRRFHPEFPELALLGYTDRAQFDGHWTPTTRACRGLIYRTDTLEVLARPFAKFFNYGQPEAGELDLDAPILGAWDKVDGSLGIQYRRPDGKLAIATRGSFASEQAIHATEHLQAQPGWPHLDGVTYLFEIVYPANRIVVDYGDLDTLVPLGAIDHETGGFGPLSPRMSPRTLREVLAAEPRPNAEGFVVWLDPFRAVKVKQEDYLALHRAVSNLTPKEVWRQLRARTFETWVAALPDEFHLRARAEALVHLRAYLEVFHRAQNVQREVVGLSLPTRRDVAEWLKANAPDVMSYVFSLIDGKDPADAIWRTLEPKGS